MKLPNALIVWLMLCSTSALAFQEKPSPEMPLPSAAAKTTAISRFAADENDVAIAQAYSPGHLPVPRQPPAVSRPLPPWSITTNLPCLFGWCRAAAVANLSGSSGRTAGRPSPSNRSNQKTNQHAVKHQTQ